MTTETRKGGRKKTGMRYDLLIDKIQPEELGKEMVNVGNLVADEEWQIVNDSEHSWQKDQSEIYSRENTNLRLLEWMHGLQADDKEK